MRNEDFLNAVGRVDEDLIAEFVEQDMRIAAIPVRKRGKRLWWVSIPAVAACLCLAIGLHYVAPLLLTDPFGEPSTEVQAPPVTGELQFWSPVIGEDVPVVEVTAKVTHVPDYIEFYQGIHVQAGQLTDSLLFTDSYYTLADPDTRMGALPPTGDYLPVYKQMNVFDRDMMDSFIQKWLPAAQRLTGITDPEYDIQWMGTSGVPGPTAYAATVRSADTERYIRFVSTENSSVYFFCPAEAIVERDAFPNVKRSDGDEAILTALEERIAYLEEVLGLSFRDADIQWRDASPTYSSMIDLENSMTVTLNGYPPAGSDALPYEIASIPAYTLELRYRYIDDGESRDELSLSGLTYSEPLNSAAYTATVGKAETLPLEKAKEYLEAGYVYGSTKCLDCRRKYCFVDVAEYDSVGLVYLKGYAGHYDWWVPFYAFYTWIGESYAVVYVPAVEVTGLEEYFAACTEQHEHTVYRK